tara:strand:+ start:2041 stop:2835 length:795 start_codon:yes stop_codon:yes gene_type:complete
MTLSTGITETVFPAVGKGMPDVITYLDEVPWSTTADVKPLKKSVMTPIDDGSFPPSALTNPTTPYLFFSKTGWEGDLDVGINATDLTVTSADLGVTMRPIVFINGPVEWTPFTGQIPQQLPESLGPFMMIDDEIMRYENPRASLVDAWTGIFYYYPETDDFIIPSVSERGMFGTTATTHLAGATIKELIVGYITGIEYSSDSEMVTIRTNIMEEFWGPEVGYYYPLPDQNQVPYLYRDHLESTPNPYAFSVPRKQVSVMGIGQS